MNGDSIPGVGLIKSVKDLRDLAYDLRSAVSRFRDAGNLYSDLANLADSCSSHAESLRKEMRNYSLSPEQSASFSGTIEGINRNIAEAKEFADRAKARGIWSFRNSIRAALGRKLREIEGQLDCIQRVLGSLDQRLAGEFRGMMSNMVLENQERINAIGRDTGSLPEIQRNAALLPGIHNRLGELLEREQSKSTPPPPPYQPSALPSRLPMAEEEMHPGINCDACQENPIRGRRWHCETCPNHDLCNMCKLLGRAGASCSLRLMSAQETQARREGATALVGLMAMLAAADSEPDTPPEVHEDVRCDGCGVCPIVGTRWHCARCFDQDLCDKCHTKGWGGLRCVWKSVSVEETRARKDAVADMLGAMLTGS